MTEARCVERFKESSEHSGAGGTPRPQPKDGRQVETTPVRPRRANGIEGGAFDGLSPGEEALVVTLRRPTLLPVDDCLYALRTSIPHHLSRSVLHRCFKRHDISRLPEMDGDKPAKKKFKQYPIGYFHIDLGPGTR